TSRPTATIRWRATLPASRRSAGGGSAGGAAGAAAPAGGTAASRSASGKRERAGFMPDGRSGGAAIGRRRGRPTPAANQPESEQVERDEQQRRGALVEPRGRQPLPHRRADATPAGRGHARAGGDRRGEDLAERRQGRERPGQRRRIGGRGAGEER